MSTEARVETLKSRHAQLEAMLASEANRPMPDETVLHSLKKEKLLVKDKMKRLGG